METSPFARLSAELRNEIYAYALYIPEGVWLNDETDEEKTKAIGNLRLKASGNLTALTMTCRQIHAEAGLLFYSINRFSIRPQWLRPYVCSGKRWVGLFRAWMDAVGSPNASCVTELCLRIGYFRTDVDPDDCLDEVINILPSRPRAWPDSLHLSVYFDLKFFRSGIARQH